MQKLYEDRWKEQTRQRGIRLGLVALAAVLATTGVIGRYALAKVRERGSRLVEKTVEPPGALIGNGTMAGVIMPVPASEAPRRSSKKPLASTPHLLSRSIQPPRVARTPLMPGKL